MKGVTWSYFPCSRGRSSFRSSAGPAPSSQASRGWISSKWAPLGWRSGKGEGKQRELRALRRLEMGKLKMFDLIPLMMWISGTGVGRAPKAPSPQGPEPRGMGRTQHGALGGRAGI